MPDQDQVAQAGAYLRMLLLRPGEYRARWEKRMDRPGAGIIGYEAVAEVLEPAAPRLPGGVGAAVDALRADDVLPGLLGEPLLEAFCAVRLAEAELFADAGPDAIAEALRWRY